MARKLSRYFLIAIISLMITCISQSSHIASASFRSPTNTRIAGTTYSLPSWWKGQDCDASHYQANNPAHAPSKIMATWNGIEACKPEPGLDPNSPYIAPVQFVPNPNQTKEQEWQCTELVKRWMLVAWGLPSVKANGDQVVSAYANAYQNEVKQILNNGQTHVFPKVGDVLSYSTVHTALVIGVKISNPPSQGNATLTLLEQNASPTGMTKQQVINWVIKGGIDDPHHTQSGAVTGWLTPRTWSIFPSPTWKHNYTTMLNSVSATSSTDAWAVGQGLIERWYKNKWQIQSTPYGSNFLSIASITSTDVWAVGDVGNQTLTEHWDGSTWRVVPSPNFGEQDVLYSVSVVSSTDVWAVGASCFSDGECQTLTEQWNSSQWSIVSSPNGAIGGVNVLNTVTVIASDDVWAVGTDSPLSGSGQTLTMNWNGSQWTILPSPNPDSISNILTGVSGGSSNDVWAVGYIGGSSEPIKTLIEYWNGTQWSVVSSPSVGTDTVLNAVVERSVNDIWAVGYDNSGSQSSSTFILHCYLWGSPSTPCQWNVIPSPNSKSFPEHKLLGVALIPNPSWDVWAVGVEYNNQIPTFQPLIERFS